MRDGRPRDELDVDAEEVFGLQRRRLGWTEVRGDASMRRSAGSGRESRPPDPRPLLRGSESSLLLLESHRSTPFPLRGGGCDSVVAKSLWGSAFGATCRFVGPCEASCITGGELVSSASIAIAALLREAFAQAVMGPICLGRR